MINIVLYEPEIALNTANIIRTAIATNSQLHLIEPLGFKLNDKTIKRYSANYIKKAVIFCYFNWAEFISQNKGSFYYLSRKANKAPSAFDFSNFQENIYFVFGKESKGLPNHLINNLNNNLIRLPMSEEAVCLNLSNTVMTIVYEACRQQKYYGLAIVDSYK